MVSRRTILRRASRLERGLGRVRQRLRGRLGRLGSLEIVPYRGYGTERTLWLTARVRESRGSTTPGPDDGAWDNFRRMVRRYASQEAPGALVRASHRTAAGLLERDVRTDQEGYVDVRFELEPPEDGTRASAGASDALWRQVALELLEPRPATDGGAPRACGEVLVPSPGAAFAVVSDIDDTVMHTGATRFLRQLVTVLFNNAHTRKPFPGVGAFYRALARGPAGQAVPNPIFYLSSSPWNVYDHIASFLELQDLPRGPLLLRELGLDEGRFLRADHREHKLRHLRELLGLYADLPFVLVGDTGQLDAEIYGEIAEELPGRVLAIYLRDVSRGRREGELAEVAERVRAASPETLLLVAEDTLAAARSAAQRGWIDSAALGAIGYEKREDEPG